jgi:hypothetical protein
MSLQGRIVGLLLTAIPLFVAGISNRFGAQTSTSTTPDDYSLQRRIIAQSLSKGPECGSLTCELKLKTSPDGKHQWLEANVTNGSPNDVSIRTLDFGHNVTFVIRSLDGSIVDAFCWSWYSSPYDIPPLVPPTFTLHAKQRETVMLDVDLFKTIDARELPEGEYLVQAIVHDVAFFGLPVPSMRIRLRSNIVRVELRNARSDIMEAEGEPEHEGSTMGP